MAPECGHQDEMSRYIRPSAWHTGGLLLLSLSPPPISWHISGAGCCHYSDLLGVYGLSSQHASFQRPQSESKAGEAVMGPGDKEQGHAEGHRETLLTMPQRLHSSFSMSSSFFHSSSPSGGRCISSPFCRWGN